MARYLRRLSLIACAFQREYTMGQPLTTPFQNHLAKVSGSEMKIYLFLSLFISSFRSQKVSGSEVKNTDRTVRVTTKDGQHYKKRSLVGQIKLRVPEEKLKNFSDKKGYGNWITRKAMQRGLLIHVSDAEITRCYSAELRGFAQYYALASNYSYAIGKLRILWIQSYLKTMANKHKMSVQKVATMLNRGSYMAVREKGKTGKIREIKLFKPKDVKREAIFDNTVDTPPLTYKYTGGSKLLKRMDAKKCEYCEKEGGYFKNHHVKKLANIKKGTQTWQRLMIARKRKTLVLCVECHDKLHAGTLPDVRHALM